MISVFIYDTQKRKLIRDIKIEEIQPYLPDKKYIVWVDLENPAPHEYNILSDVFNFHPLTIEDCKTFSSTPKIDEFENYIFLVFHRISFDIKNGELETKEIDFFLGKDFLVSVHEGVSDSVNLVKNRINSNGIIGQGPDFIMHSIIDTFVDKYAGIMDEWEDEVEKLEERIISGNLDFVLAKIIELRRNIVEFKKSIAPQRDIIKRLARKDNPYITKKAVIYYSDIYDNLIRHYSNLESTRDLLNSTFDTYLLINSNKMNEVVKKLTIIATIFLPLTFIASIYGMNFDFMPELRWQYGYFSILTVMLLTAVFIVWYMKKNKWV